MVRRKGPASVAAAISIAAAMLFPLLGSPAAAVVPTWFDLPAADSFPQGLAAGPDGSTWVASRFADQIVRVSPDGSQTTFSLEFGVDPHTIALGADGAMWFTEHNGARIGRLTTGGDLSEYFLAERASPTGIAAGPDGAMWFAERGVSAIARITSDGVVTEWPTLTPRAAPLGVTAGPDGALWFTEPTVDRIGRITTGGQMTEFPLPAGRSPQWITSGPDGALWFTERGANAIGRMTVDGSLTEFPLDGAWSGLNGITVGPDGALWFTESASDMVGRIGLRGRVVEIPLGEGASPTGIAAGPDGQIWFSAPGLNRVGRLALTAAADATPPTVTIVSPPNGSVLLEREGMLADYWCADEPGGSGLVSCDGPAADGAVIDTSLGSHSFTVTATDAQGNTASSTHSYVVFAGIGGPITTQWRFAAGRVIPITLKLGARPAGAAIFADGSPTVRQADCVTKEPIGAEQTADVQVSVSGDGRLRLLWQTKGGWGGTCRSLVLRFAWADWSDADAVFTLRFS